MGFEFPCKKCPSLAICIHQRQVDCTILFRLQVSHKMIFRMAKDVLPKLESICDGNICVWNSTPYYVIKDKRRIIDEEENTV